MYIVIVGGGRVGTTIAQGLIEAKHEVVIIDKSLKRCCEIDSEMGAISVLGDGSEANILSKAGANRADILMACTDMDDVNLVTCQLARHRFGLSHTIALISNPDYQGLFEKIGIDVVINTSQLIIDAVSDEFGTIMAGVQGDLE